MDQTSIFPKSSILDVWQGSKYASRVKVNIGEVRTKPVDVILASWPILSQCSISITPGNVLKPEVFLAFSGGIEMGHWLKPNKGGLFEDNFFWGGQFEHPLSL